MKFSLRTLIVLMLLGGPGIAGAWWTIKAVPFLAMYGVLFMALFVMFCLTRLE